MAGIQPVSFTAPASDYAFDQAEIQRRQKLAELLQAESMKSTGTETAPGGWAVRKSPWEGIGKIAQAFAGSMINKQSQDQQRELSQRYQSDYQKALTAAMGKLQGSPAQMQDTASEGTGSFDMSGATGPQNTPAQAPDPMGALAAAGSHPMAQQLIGPLAMQQIQLQQRQKMMADIMRGGGQAQPGAQGQAAGGFGAGIPPQIMALMTSGDPELVGLGKSLLEANKGIAQRPGAPVVNPFTGAVIAQPTPAVPAGVGLQVGPGGPQAYPVPGAIPAMAGVTQTQAGAQEAGKAPYKLDSYQTEGAPTLMTQEQAIQAATGQPMPQPGVRQAPQLPQGQAIQGTAPSLPAAMQQFAGGGGQPRTVEIQPPRRAGLRLQDQGAGAEQKEVGKGLGEYTIKTQAEAANAAVANRSLDNMIHEADNIRMGKLAPAQSSLIQWGQALGLPVSEESKKTAGSIQALSSMAIKMAGQATRASDAQPSQLQFLKTLESMPTAERTADGFLKITNYLRDLNNYNIAKHQQLQQWRGAHGGSAEGFEAEWPKVANSLPFIWNQAEKSRALKDITAGGNDPLGIRNAGNR